MTQASQVTSMNFAGATRPQPHPIEDCLVHFQTTQGVRLRTLFEVCSQIVVHGNLVFKKEGCTLQSLGPAERSHSVYTHVFMPADSLIEYTCRAPTTAGINFQLLFKAFRSVNPDDSVTFQITRDSMENSMPAIEVFVEVDDEVVCHVINLMDLSDSVLDVESHVFDCIVRMPADTFQKYIRTAENHGESIQLLATCSPKRNHIYLHAKGMVSQFFVCIRFNHINVTSAARVLKKSTSEIEDGDEEGQEEGEEGEDESEDDGVNDNVPADSPADSPADLPVTTAVSPVVVPNTAAPGPAPRQLTSTSNAATANDAENKQSESGATPNSVSSLLANNEPESLRRTSNKRDCYSLRLLTAVAKCSSMSKYVYIFLSENYPLLLRYGIGTLGDITFAVAALYNDDDKEENENNEDVPTGPPSTDARDEKTNARFGATHTTKKRHKPPVRKQKQQHNKRQNTNTDKTNSDRSKPSALAGKGKGRKTHVLPTPSLPVEEEGTVEPRPDADAAEYSEEEGVDYE